MNLTRIKSLDQNFPYIVGLSDHSEGWKAPLIATALGSKVIEKHFTLSKNLPGVDHFFSMNPQGLKEMIDNVRLAENSLGGGSLLLTEAEKETRKLARRSIVARCNIPPGSTITKEHLIIKRPGTGIPPKNMQTIIGKVTNTEILEDTLIERRMLQ